MDFSYMKNFMNRLCECFVPGNSVCVFAGGKEVFRYSSGFSDLENGVKMTGEEYLNIYSCSKIATVTAALQLYEQGFFLLDDPLCEYIPEYAEMSVLNDGVLKPAKNKITLRHLFTMTAGLTYNTSSPAFERARKATGGQMNTLAVVKALADEPLAFEPGVHWCYSLCHDVLAAVVEVISGEKFGDYVRHNIFEPLGMSRSFYHTDTDISKKTAEQYIYKESSDCADIVRLQSSCRSKSEGGHIESIGKGNSLVFGEKYDSGGAGIITTVGDYALFCAALANLGTGINGERILSPGTVELLQRNQLNAEQLNDFNWRQLKGYGYGLGVRTVLDAARAGYTGVRGEFGWGGAAGATAIIDTEMNVAAFYAHHMLNPKEEYYQPRLRNVLYTCVRA